MNGSKHSTHPDFDRDDAPDLSANGWPEKFAKATVRRGRATRCQGKGTDYHTSLPGHN